MPCDISQITSCQHFQTAKWVISGYRFIELWWVPKKGNINQVYFIIRFLSLIISMLTFIEYYQHAKDSLATVKANVYPF